MAKNKKNKMGIGSVGQKLGLRELKSLSKGGGDPLAIMSNALKNNISLGRKVVNAYSSPGGLQSAGFNWRYGGTPDNLAPLKGLSLGKGQAYMGATATTTPGRTGKMWNSPTGPKTTYTPIISTKGMQISSGKQKKKDPMDMY